MSTQTTAEYKTIIEKCKHIFMQKTRDYGTAWRILRPASLTDQIFIKANRIRSIQEKQEQKIEEDIRNEFVGIINYCLIALIQLRLTSDDPMELDIHFVEEQYDLEIRKATELVQNKNHDYDEAWRKMRVSSMTDIILMKVLRTKQIEDNNGKTLISEGIDANYQDMINYAIFCLILLKYHEE